MFGITGLSGSVFADNVTCEQLLLAETPCICEFMKDNLTMLGAGASNNPDEQQWYTAQGNISGDTAELILYETLGGQFEDPQAVSIEKIGTMTIDFQDCSNALLSYVLTDEALQYSIAISRGIPGAQALCEELNTVK